MATTYTLISSNVLSSSAASVTFSSIPSTYTDLVLRVSARTTYGGGSDGASLILNSDTGSNYSYVDLRGSGSAASSAIASNITGQTYIANCFSTSTSTTNTFGNLEIYIPSYLISQNKPLGSFGVMETNAASAYLAVGAELWRNTAAISTIRLESINAANFVSGSSFYLYGIKATA